MPVATAMTATLVCTTSERTVRETTHSDKATCWNTLQPLRFSTRALLSSIVRDRCHLSCIVLKFYFHNFAILCFWHINSTNFVIVYST